MNLKELLGSTLKNELQKDHRVIISLFNTNFYPISNQVSFS